jgi:hypothetical protein
MYSDPHLARWTQLWDGGIICVAGIPAILFFSSIINGIALVYPASDLIVHLLSKPKARFKQKTYILA